MDSESNDSRALGATVDVQEPELERVSPGDAGEPVEDTSGLSRHVIRRNMFFCILLDTIWMTGYQDFAMAVQPLLVHLDASNKLIGFAIGSTWAAMLGFFLTPWITRRFPIKKWYLFVVNIPYMGAIGVAGLIVVLSRRLDIPDPTLLVIVVGSVIAMNFFSGFVALPHQEYVAACIPATHRGRYSGLSMSIGAIFSIGSTAIAGVILYKLAKPMSFGYLFLMTWVLCQGGYWFAVFAKERPTPVDAAPKPWSKQMLLAFWRDKPYVRFLTIWAIPTITYQPILSFMMVYGMKVLHMEAYTVAPVAIISLVGRAVFAAPSGAIVDRFGAKRILPLGPLSIALVYAILVLWPSPWAIYVATAISTPVGNTINTAMTVLQYGLPKPENRAGHYTIQNIVSFITGSIGVMMGGLLLDQLQFRTAFALAAIVALLFYPFLRWMIRPLSDRVEDYS